MRVSVLSSGSKGNCTFVSILDFNLLIDCGTTATYIENNLNEISVNPETIKYILITHTHVDHVSALKVFIKKYNPVVILTKKMHKDIPFVDNFIYINNTLNIENIIIRGIKTSHDASESLAYIIEYFNKSMVYLTDTGYINKKNKEYLINHNLYVFESNHDIDMLMNSSRPHHIKIRILGDNGHLSNIDSFNYLSEFVGDKTEHIVLAHLSSEANSEELVRDIHLKHNKNILIARQNERTELINL